MTRQQGSKKSTSAQSHRLRAQYTRESQRVTAAGMQVTGRSPEIAIKLFEIDLFEGTNSPI